VLCPSGQSIENEWLCEDDVGGSQSPRIIITWRRTMRIGHPHLVLRVIFTSSWKFRCSAVISSCYYRHKVRETRSGDHATPCASVVRERLRLVILLSNQSLHAPLQDSSTTTTWPFGFRYS
jgi:hypothetical protein